MKPKINTPTVILEDDNLKNYIENYKKFKILNTKNIFRNYR
jgi:hypothetical protein